MEQALHGRPAGQPDVIKSALDKKDMKINSATIDTVLGAPEKIFIPERYVPDTVGQKLAGATNRVNFSLLSACRTTRIT